MDLGRASTQADEPTNRRSPRVSISLTGEALAAVEAMATKHGISEGETVRRAIKVLKFLDDEMARGTIFRMQTPDGESERIRLVYT